MIMKYFDGHCVSTCQFEGTLKKYFTLISDGLPILDFCLNYFLFIQIIGIQRY